MSVFIYFFFLLQKTLSLLVSRGLLTRLTLREVLKSIFLPVLVFLPSCLSLNLYRLSQTSGWWSDPGSSSVSDWHHYSSKWVHFSAVHIADYFTNRTFQNTFSKLSLENRSSLAQQKITFYWTSDLLDINVVTIQHPLSYPYYSYIRK